ncbi:MAG: SGNH/GDSL hydrolase family protein [Verrucomicrobiota bacterium]
MNSTAPLPPLTIAYFGGSITEGYNASDPARTSWRALTTVWLQAQLPTREIREINAAIGGTGSDLGAFRLRRDVLAGKPDVVFVEFAVNDKDAAPERIQRALEGIIRAIRREQPAARIYLVFTLEKSHLPNYQRGELPVSVRLHEQIARHYGVPCFHLARTLVGALAEGRGSWDELFCDEVHPVDAGFAFYAAELQSLLFPRLSELVTPRTNALPAPMISNAWENGRLIDAWDLAEPGWVKENESLANRFPHRLASATPGAELRLRFHGSAVGVYWLIGPDSGDVEVSLDGGPFGRFSSWDKYALHFTRANYTLFAEDLPSGEHELILRVHPERAAQATGNWVRIGAFLGA